MSMREGNTTVDADLLADLDLDPSDPEVAEALEDAEALADLVNQLVALRRALDLVQRQVAGHMGTTQSAVSDFERIGGDPRLSTVQRYARALGARLCFSVDTSRCWEGGWRRLAYETGEAASWAAAPRQDPWPVNTDDFSLAA